MNRERLASVMRIRQIQERAARGTLAVRRRDLRVASAAEQETWDHLDRQSSGDLHARGPQPATVLLAQHTAIGAGVLAAATQHGAAVTAGVAVEHAVVDWSLAARRVEGLERLADRHRTIEQEEAVRRSANEIDDLVLVRFTGDHV